MSTPSPSPIESLTYEQAFSQLEQIVAALEGEEHTLDESLALFERGQALSRRCTMLLEQAELKVKQILGDELVDFNIEV